MDDKHSPAVFIVGGVHLMDSAEIRLRPDVYIEWKDGKCLLLDPDSLQWAVLDPKAANLVHSLVDGFAAKELERNHGQSGLEFCRRLAGLGFLAADRPRPEQAVDSGIDQSSTFPLLAAWVNVTDNCNLQCRHCFLGNTLRPSGVEELTVAELDSLFSDMVSLAGNVPVDLDITGGEPLLRRDICAIVDTARRDGLKPRIITNGTLVSREVAHFLGVNSITTLVSLDGPTKESHEFLRGPQTFDPAVRGLQTLLEFNVPVGLSMTVHQKNQELIESYLDFASHLAVKSVNFSLLNPLGRAAECHLEPADELAVYGKLLQIAACNTQYRDLLQGSGLSKLLETILVTIESSLLRNRWEHDCRQLARRRLPLPVFPWVTLSDRQHPAHQSACYVACRRFGRVP